MISQKTIKVNSTSCHVQDLHHHSPSTGSKSKSDMTKEDCDRLYISQPINDPIEDKSEHNANEEAPCKQLKCSIREKT